MESEWDTFSSKRVFEIGVLVLRPEKIRLWVDNDDVDLKADGSDFVTVIAAFTDKECNVKCLNNSIISFEISGEGLLMGNEAFIANPRQLSALFHHCERTTHCT